MLRRKLTSLLPRLTTAAIRRNATHAAAGAYTSGSDFVPNGSYEVTLAKPHTETWYGARPSYDKVISVLETDIQSVRRYLHKEGVLSSIDGEISTLLELDGEERKATAWLKRGAMAEKLHMGRDLRSSEYRNLTAVLNELSALLRVVDVISPVTNDASPDASPEDFVPTRTRTTPVPQLSRDPIAEALSARKDFPFFQEFKEFYDANQGVIQDGARVLSKIQAKAAKAAQGADAAVPETPASLSEQLRRILDTFSAASLLGAQSARTHKYGTVDRLGRIMSHGARKEAEARVWIRPAKEATIGRLLVNNKSILDYFPQRTLRESVTAPLRLTGTTGRFNIFALARGGGLSSQAGAISMALSRGLVQYEKELASRGEKADDGEFRDVLMKAKTLLRDPRMVERKKTGQPKARKMPTWVKR